MAGVQFVAALRTLSCTLGVCSTFWMASDRARPRSREEVDEGGGRLQSSCARCAGHDRHYSELEHCSSRVLGCGWDCHRVASEDASDVHGDRLACTHAPAP